MLTILLTVFFACEESKPCVEPSSNSTKAESMGEEGTKKPDNGVSISEAEATMLKPYLEDIRIGVREWSSESVGLCKKEGKGRDCSEYVGLNADPVPEGTYMIRGEFQAPKIKPEGGWKVKLSVDCEIVRKSNNSESKTEKSYSKEYEVVHVVGEKNGYRLSPMYSITSPSTRGDERCKWTIEANNLDGPKVWEGAYMVPYKG